MHLNLIDKTACGPRGELAADRTSQFARSLGVFALIPSRSETGGTSLQVVIGARSDAHLSHHCRDDVPISWSSMTEGEREWTVEGSVEDFTTTWIIDSVTSLVHLPLSIFESTIEAIQAVTPYSLGMLASGTVGSCDSGTLDRLPIIRVSIGVGVQIALTGRDYVYLRAFDRRCISRLRPWVPSVGQPKMGYPVLNKLVTVFDKDLDRMGFCAAKFPI